MRYCVVILILCSWSCDDGSIFGRDSHYSLRSDQKFLFKAGTLEYTSGQDVVKFDVIAITTGQHKVTKSGTCGKPPFSIYEYQVAYLKPSDSLTRTYNLLGTSSFSCSGVPSLESRLISFLNIGNGDRLNWFNLLNSYVKNGTPIDRFVAGTKTYTDIFMFNLPTKSAVSQLYYHRQYGIVAYRLQNGTQFNLKWSFFVPYNESRHHHHQHP